MATLACIAEVPEETIKSIIGTNEETIHDIKHIIDRYNKLYKSENKCIIAIMAGHPFRQNKHISLINNYGQIVVHPTYEMVDEDEHYIHDYCDDEPLTTSEIECIQNICKTGEIKRIALLLDKRHLHKTFTVECMKKLNNVSAVKGITLDNLINSILEYIPVPVKREAETKAYFTELNERRPPEKRTTINFQSVDTWINIGNLHIFAQIKWCNKSHPATDLREKYSANMDIMINMLKDTYGLGTNAIKLWICKKAGPKLQEAALDEGITIIDADEGDTIYSFAKKSITALLKYCSITDSSLLAIMSNQIDLIEAQTVSL